MSAAIQPLTSLTLGSSAVVREIKVPAEHRSRLLEMGLLVGTTVELVRFAPLGDPVEIKVRGYNLTLRKNEAEQILVQPKTSA
jgi:ferrous iron transport protein A